MSDLRAAFLQQRRQRRANLIVRHWRGDCSLAFSYWINGLLAGLAVLLVAAGLATVLQGVRQPWLYLGGLLLIWVIALLCTLWQVVGVWRSAARTKRVKGTRFWPIVAQILMVLTGLNLARIAVVQAAPQLRDAVRYVRGDPRLGAHAVRILRGGQELEISGPFAWGLAQQLVAALHAAPQAHLVHLDSIGGRIGVALDVADIIRAHHLDTYVSHFCASACTLAFLAGERRWLGPRGRIGFHSGIAPVAAASLFANRLFRGYYAQDGLPPAFLDRVFHTSPHQMWFPTRTELLAAHVVTDQAQDGMFAVSGFGPHPSPATVEAGLLRVPVYAALRRTDPDWPELLHEWDDTIIAGEPITPFEATMRTHVIRTLHRLLPVAPEPALRQLAALLIEEAQIIQRVDPDACWSYLHGGHIDLRHYLGAGLVAADLTVTANVLMQTADHPQPPIGADARRTGLQLVQAELDREGLQPAQVLAGLRAEASHATFCPAWLALLHAALLAPDETGISPLRSVFSGR